VQGANAHVLVVFLYQFYQQKYLTKALKIAQGAAKVLKIHQYGSLLAKLGD